LEILLYIKTWTQTATTLINQGV